MSAPATGSARLAAGVPTVAPSRADPLVRWSAEGLGGPLGRRAALGSSWWTPLRVLIVLAVLAGGLGLLAKQSCRDNGWTTPHQFVHVCYSDIPALYTARGLDVGAVPYLDDSAEPVEYPVLTGAAMWVSAQFVADDADNRALRYFDVNALALAAAGVVVVGATARTVRRRPWDAALVALSPSLVLAMYINWDLYAVALTSLALLAWSRRRPGLAGVLLGLAVAAKFYPLLLFGPLALLCLRTGHLRELGRTVGAAAAAWLAVNLPVALADWDGWVTFYTFSRERGTGWSSPWLLFSLLGGEVPEPLNALAGGTFFLCCAGIAVLALRAPRRPRLAQLCFLVLAAFVCVNKVYSPQFVVWLVPLAALARPVWRDHLVWALGEVIHFVGVWLYFVGMSNPERGLSDTGYAWTILAHLAGTLWLAATVVRDVLNPDKDPVRMPGGGDQGSGQPADDRADDPGGGPFDGAPDVRARIRQSWRLGNRQRHRDAASSSAPGSPVPRPGLAG